MMMDLSFQTYIVIASRMPILDDPYFLAFCRSVRYEWSAIKPILMKQYPFLFHIDKQSVAFHVDPKTNISCLSDVNDW